MLLLSPSFHDYDAAFAKAFATQGVDVTTHLYDRNATFRAKARTKALFELPEKLGADRTGARAEVATRGALAALREVRPDLVLIIKGDVLGADVWEHLRASGTPHVLWLYDELRRTRWSPDALAALPSIATYSALDATALQQQGLESAHVPLGFDHLMPFPRRPRSGEVTFIGARYPQRELLMSAIAAQGTPARAFGRDWSADPRDRLRTWSWRRPEVPAGRDLDRAAAYGVMEASAGTLNIHGDQDGFTMRTFEAAGVGAVQICDRADVSEHYEPGAEVLVAESPEEMRETAARLVRDPGAVETLRAAARRRTLAEHTLVQRARNLLDLL